MKIGLYSITYRGIWYRGGAVDVFSLVRLAKGLGVALLVGIPLGFILGGWFPRLTHFLRPLLRLLGQINAFSLFPLFVLFFGIGALSMPR